MRGLTAMTAQRSILLPRMRSAWPLLLSVLLSTLIASGLVAAFAGFAATALPQAVSSEVTNAAHTSVAISGAIDGPVERTDDRVVRARLAGAFGTVPFAVAHAVWSDPIGLPVPAGARTIPIVQAAVMDQVRAHVLVTAGTWPSGVIGRAAGQAVLPAAVPASVAAALRLSIGRVLVLRDRSTGATVRFEVTGFYRPRDPAQAYWGVDLIPPAGVSEQPGFITFGPLIVNRDAFSTGHLAIGGGTWLYTLRTTKIAAGRITSLSNRITQALSYLTGSADLGGLQATSGLPGVLHIVATKLVVARSLLLVGELELLLLAGAALTLTARTLASQREEESAIFSSRGAGRRQLLGMAVTEALIVTVIAAGAGAVLGSRLTGLLSSVGALRAAGLKVTGIPADDWLTVGVVLLLCTVIMSWPALRSITPGAAAVRRGRRAAGVIAASAGADVALLALAGLAGWQLRVFSVLGRTPSGIGIDPVLAVAPAVALAAGTVLPLRLLPLLARAGDRLAARTRRLGGALTSWELSRHAARQSAPMLLVVLAVGTSTLALAQHQSWRQSAFDQATFLVGADARADTVLPATPATAWQITHASGVTTAMAVSTGLTAPGNGQVLAVDASRAARTVLLRSDQGRSSPALWRKIEPRGTPHFIALPGHPVRLRIDASMNQGKGQGIGPVPVTVTLMDGSGITFTLPAGNLPPDGRPHALVVDLTATGRAVYPLRLLAVTAGFTVPLPTRPHHRPGNRKASFTVIGLAASAAPSGPFTGRLAAAALAGWIPSVAAPGFAQDSAGVPPELFVGRNQRRPGSVPLRFETGAGFSSDPFSVNPPKLPIDGQVMLRAPAPANAISAIATSAFLKANSLTVGAEIQIMAESQPINVIIVAEVRSFPTITTPAGLLIVDETAVQEQVNGYGQPAVPVTEWWLATRKGGVPRGLPPGTAVLDRNVLAAALLSDPMSAIPQQAIQATAIAAALLAVLGFSVAVAGSVRERRSQTALLAALGVDGRGQARLLCLEALALSVPAAATGLALGALLAHLLVPSVTLTATAAAPAVPVLVKVPLATVAGIALIVTAIPVLAAAASAIYRPDPAAELRTAT